jgi:hypothetical protein
VAAVKYIFYPGGNNLPVSLGDDAVGDRVSNAVPTFVPANESVMFGNADFKLQIEHGNAEQTLTWQVYRFHGTEAVAGQFRDTHGQSIPVIVGVAQGILQELFDDGTTRWFQNCTRPSVRFTEWVGASTVCEYTVKFGKITKTKNGV